MPGNGTCTKADLAAEAATATERVLLENGGLGASIALVLDGELVFAEGVGWRDPLHKAGVRHDDEFHITASPRPSSRPRRCGLPNGARSTSTPPRRRWSLSRGSRFP